MNEFFSEDEQLTGEQLLFVAIIQRAILDVQVMKTLPAKAPVSKHARIRHVELYRDGRDAAQFLFLSPDLEEWADLVGVNAGTIRHYARREFPEYRRVSCSNSSSSI